MASSSEENKAMAAACSGEEKKISMAAACSGEEKKKQKEKKKMKKVRMPQDEVDMIMAYKDRPLTMPPGFENYPKKILDCFPVPADQLGDFFAKINEVYDKAGKPLLEEQERVRKEYEEKGYAEYWITDDDEDESAPRSRARAPAPGRRRPRSGVVKKHTGGTKKL
uniref:Uncharacterized protein n=1 Tax=Leersia perrieri TaxID=77586 RepID=A0A0D9XUK8_9ORYZ